MATIARRLTADGILSISGEFDEVTQSTISLTTTTYYAATFDEVTINGGGTAMRETSTGTIMVAAQLNEVDKPS